MQKDIIHFPCSDASHVLSMPDGCLKGYETGQRFEFPDPNSLILPPRKLRL
jgi:hypothetical protein